MPDGTYGGVRGRRTKVGRKLLRFPPTRLFLDAYCIGKHQILCKSSKFLEFLLASYGILKKISYLCPPN